MRHMAGVTHAFLFLDHGISQEQILEAVQSGFKDRDGYAAYRIHAWAEFNPTPFLTESTVQASAAHSPRHSTRAEVGSPG